MPRNNPKSIRTKAKPAAKKAKRAPGSGHGVRKTAKKAKAATRGR